MTTSNRTLRGKGPRNALLKSSKGRCEICGTDIAKSFHADHVVPHSLTQRTNVHEMAPLCAACNWAKGARGTVSEVSDIFKLHEISQMRPFALEHAENMLNSESKFFFGDIATALGKTELIPISLKICRAMGTAAQVCVVVPSVPLRRQVASDFLDESSRARVGHSFTLNESSNDFDPSRGCDGFATTYQSVVADSAGITADEIEHGQYLVVLDEVHHVAREGTWHKAVQPLVDAAEKVVLLSGSAERGDQAPIAFLPYQLRGGDRV